MFAKKIMIDIVSFLMPPGVCANLLFLKEAFYHTVHSPPTLLLCYPWQTSCPATAIAALSSNRRWLGICKGQGALLERHFLMPMLENNCFGSSLRQMGCKGSSFRESCKFIWCHLQKMRQSTKPKNKLT